LAGVTAIESRVGWPTVSVAEAVREPEVAVMVALPIPAPAASPPLVTVAISVEDELQFAVLVRSCVLPSLYVPVAVNCWVVPLAMDAVDGATDNEVSTGGVTVRAAEALIVPEVAVIVELPWVRLVTSPALLTDAVAVEEEVHVRLVRFCVVPSL
jgi:hypothetical protein